MNNNNSNASVSVSIQYTIIDKDGKEINKGTLHSVPTKQEIIKPKDK